MNELIDQLIAAFEDGSITRFADLTPEQFSGLKEIFSSGRSEEKQALLRTFVLLADGHDAEISEFNSMHWPHKIPHTELVDGSSILSASLLTWAGPGQGYNAAFDLLMQLPVRKVTAADWPIIVD